MPLYEYECTACHKHTEKIQKFSDPEITACPHCGGTLQRVITAPAIAFKGGGWYADGYGNAKPAGSGEAKAESTPKAEAATPAADSKSPSSSESSASATTAPVAATTSAAASASDKK